MQWEQNYLPLPSLALSVSCALIPLFLLLYLLVVRKVRGYWACGITLGVTFGLAVLVWRMPLSIALGAVTNGMAFGLFPIGWIIFHAIWLYNMTVESKQFEVIKTYLSFLTTDRRLQAVLIGFVFASCLEATAGFGTPVAISAALLIGLGFKPMQAATLALISNSAPVVFGALALPLTVGSALTGVDITLLAKTSALQLIPLCTITPFVMSCVVAGFRDSLKIAPVLLGAGLLFSLTQYGVSLVFNPYLPQLLASFVLFFSFCLLLRYWKPQEIWRFPNDLRNGEKNPPSLSELFRAGLPFLILAIVVFFWADTQYTGFKIHLTRFELGFFDPRIPWFNLHEQVIKVAPIVKKSTAYPAIFSFNILSTPGSAVLLAGLLAIPTMKNYSFIKALKCYGRTLYQLRFALLTLPIMLGLAYLLNYSGISSTIGLLFLGTAGAFPLFSALIGYIGLFMTGSETSTNALFGPLQVSTGEQLGMAPDLALSTNMIGGGAAKMISPQVITIATGATCLVGKEGDLLLRTWKISLYYLAIVAIYTWILNYFMTN